ncbi:cobyrinate a,c-diamide synthase [Mucilaginibacter aquaedulcis]|uniref:cobyrinate a,c-diamide synthase n=1 Tax=Mucilaginibacter aquaedulcis TaxID=1187081 RepID=UPI0025B45B3A|nr:cobyrinate a,c-diamide synthase [Mucilaginibacter aquaedulcis]MDN3548218.1 cobyrinate a,c-diamide synthase [Mucilaginibacter aquaedulcis]
MPDRSQFLIAAPSSDSGKTTVTLGLLRAIANRGLKVQPFKCGPDYIDPILHQKASDNNSINLDTYMASSAHVKGLYNRYLQKSDVAIVEGVMGLFDGADKMKGSSAEIAMLLDIPIILVMNAKAMAYSAAALIHGFKSFQPILKIAGVIFNNVNTPSHYNILKEACKDVDVEPLGYLPTQPDVKIPSRHLGLSIAADINFDTLCDKIATSLKETVDIQRLLELTTRSTVEKINEEEPANNRRYTIAVAHDEAFRFTYHENLEVLKEFGRVVYFSPLTDSKLPPCDLLYLAGGYPELFVEQLSQNKSMLNAVHKYCLNNGKTYAECGGMMYLGEYIIDKQGKQFQMAGFLPLTTSMENPKLHLGYRSIFVNDLNIKGHEFHYSTCTELSEVEKLDCTVFNARQVALTPNIYRKNNTLASYNHLYWGEEKTFIDRLLQGKL